MKRWLKIVAAALGSLILLALIGVVVVVWSPALTPVARRVLRDIVPGVEFERIGIDGFLTIQLQNVRAMDEDGVECARIGSAELQLAPKSILKKRIHVQTAVLRDVDFHVRTTSSDRICIITIVPPSEPAPEIATPASAFPLAIQADSLTLENARLFIHGSSFDQPTLSFAIEAVQLSGGFSDPLAYADIEAIDAVMFLAGQQVRASLWGSANWMVPYSLGDAALMLHAEMDPYIADIVVDASVDAGNIASNIAIALKGFGDLGVSSIVSIEPELEIAAYLRAPHLDLAPLKLKGHATTQALVHMHGVPFEEGTSAEAAIDLRGSTFEDRRLDDARLAVKLDGPEWTLTRASVKAQGVSVLASGHGTLDSVHGEAKVSFAGNLPVPKVQASIGRLALDASADINAKAQKFSVSGVIERAHIEGAVDVAKVSLVASAQGGGKQARFDATVDAKGVVAAGFEADVHVAAKRLGTTLEAHVKASSKSGGKLPADLTVSADAVAAVKGAAAFIPSGFEHILPSVRGVVTAEAHNFMLNRDVPLNARVVASLETTLAVEAGVFMPTPAGTSREVAHLSADTPRSVLQDPVHFDWKQPLRVRVTSRDFPLQALREAIAGVPQLDGIANVDINVMGNLLTSHATASINVTGVKSMGILAQRVSVLANATIDRPLDAVMPVKVASAHVEVTGLGYSTFKAGGISVDAKLADGKGNVVVLGRWPDGSEWLSAHAALTNVPTKNATIDATAKMRNFDVALLKAFVPELQVKGKLALDAKANGSLLQPDFSGDVSLKEGMVAYQSFPGVQDLSLHGKISGSQILVDELKGKGAGGHGTLSATAELTLDKWAPKKAHASVTLDKFLFNLAVIRDAQLTTEVIADLSFENGIVGKILLDQGSLEVGSLGGGDRPVGNIGSVPDVHFVQFGQLGQLSSDDGRAQASVTRTHIDIEMSAKKVSVRNDKNVLAVTANLRLQDTEDGVSPRGIISVPAGRIEVLSRLYEIERARVSLDGGEDMDPALDVRITRQFPRALVVIEVRGSAKKPVLGLSSNPAIYDRAQLLALVITGKEEVISNSSAGPSQSSTATTEQIAGTVASAVLGPFAATLGKKVGLDIVRVGMDRPSSARARSRRSLLGENRASLELGKFITDRLYVGARGVLGASDLENSYEARLEYGLTERLRLESSFGDRGVGGLDLMWRFVY